MKHNKNNGSNVPNLRFPEFEEEWKEVRLKDVCTFFSGGTPTSTNKEYYNGNIPFIRSGEINSNSTELFISKEAYDSSSAKMVAIGDILIALYGATSGEIGVCKIEGAINQAILCLRTSQNKLFVKFEWENRINSILKTYLQGGQGNLSADIIKRLKFSFSTLIEQEKIALFLSLIDERISTQTKIIEDLKLLKSAMEERLLSHKLTFNDINTQWQTTTFGQITSNFNQRNKANINYPVYSVTNDKGFIRQSEKFEERIIAGDDLSAYKIIKSGEFAYNPARINVGSIARYEEKDPCVISSLYVCIKPNVDIYSDWLYHLLKSKRTIFYYNLYSEGGVRLYLFYPNFARIKFMLPSYSEQEKIANTLNVLNNKTLHESAILNTYMQQKQYLLQNLFI